MSEIINFTRLTTSDKLEDRFLTCQVYQPIDPEQAESGMIFSQIEIMNPWFPTSQVGQTVINTLIREYYRGSDTSELVNFENAIKKVNEALAQIAQNGETDWIGKLSGVLVLYNKNEIHFAQTGNSQAYLYRGSKINHITEGLDLEEAPHPLKTFTNITSGSLEVGDKIAIANSTFFDIIKPLELRRIITAFNPTLTAIETAKILKMNAARQGNGIFIELTTKEELANIPPDQKIEAIYLDQSGGNFDLKLKSYYLNTLKPTLTKAAIAFSSFFHSSGKKLAPHLKRGWEATRSSSKSVFGKIKKPKPDVDLGPQETPAEVEIEESENTLLAEAPAKLEPRNFFLKLKNRLRRILIHFGFYSPKKSRMILPILIAVFLVLGLILGSSFYLRSRGNADRINQDKANQVTSLENDAVNATTKGDETKALSDYKQIISIASDLKGTKYESNISAAAERAAQKIKELVKLTPLSAQTTIDLDPQVIALTNIGNFVATVLGTGEIREAKTPATTFSTLSKVALPSGKIVSATYLKDTDTLAFMFDNKTLSTYNVSEEKWQNEKLKTNYAGKLSGFSSNIYILDPADNQIWKSASESGSYNSQTGFIKDTTVSIADAVAVAIDGNVFTLSKSGEIIKFSRGEKAANFAIALPSGEKINSWSGLFTTENTSNLFASAVENGTARIVQLNKSGTFISQYQLEGITNPETLIVDSESKTIFAQSANKVLLYKF